MLGKNLADINFAPVRSIAFDLFNTLVYISEPQEAHKELFASLSLSKDERKEVKNTLLTKDTTDLFLAFPVQHHKRLAALTEGFNHKVRNEVKSTVLYQDSMSTLKALSKKYPLHLISNLATPYKEIVKQLEIEQYFSSVLFSCDLGVAKPNKDIFQLLGKPSKDILMIGDSYHSDFVGSQNAGLQSILLRRNRTSLPHPMPSVDSLLSLVDLLA
jgi:FMN phosphatase YigB (HAD superfamily)